MKSKMLQRASLSSPSPSLRRERRARLPAPVACLLAALLSLSFMVEPAWALRPVRVYEVDIRGEATGPAVQEAMRRVLVRATGHRDAGTDPAFGTLVAEAERYVQSSRKTASGATVVVFDSAAIEQAIQAEGRSVWPRERPFTFVVFHPSLNAQAFQAARAELDRAAEVRGLPINLAPVPVVDATGIELPREAVLQSAQRLGGDAVLIARSDNPSAPGIWQWTLQTEFGSESWTGALDAGVNGAVDAMMRAQEASASISELEAFVQIAGVATLNDYAAVGRLLENIPGQKRVSLAEANGTTATFSVLVRGGADAVDRALGNSPRLARGGAANGRLLYTYRP
jgi:hypothetical protein